MIKLKLFNRTALQHRLSINLLKSDRDLARRVLTKVAASVGVEILGWRPETQAWDADVGRIALSVTFQADSGVASLFQQRVLSALADQADVRVQLESSTVSGGALSAASLQQRAADYRGLAPQRNHTRQGPLMSQVLPYGMTAN
ncbi:hypothetical protein [Alcaligenes endophyticus]|uniref:Uncharacterized protein n=1 Tax=Alcaligenes endophyticus TaxID=1929088 RepID=A0ABT8EM03_9BURK|nr:hypothetical protein [Alcaligenes endophyticus]MCX5591129.1 hypothetical protein [Alcaligenes endophyticus]MDN4122293.1 hypothetical protein [Alcaligenes endophyticus]